jgi:hypothetical protein
MLPTGDPKSEAVPDKKSTTVRTSGMCRGLVVMSASSEAIKFIRRSTGCKTSEFNVVYSIQSAFGRAKKGTRRAELLNVPARAGADFQVSDTENKRVIPEAASKGDCLGFGKMRNEANLAA